MQDIFYANGISYIIVKLCVLFLAFLLWYFCAASPVV
ncbi:hypothetical protein PCC7424_3702 [Gloeothece citriformis PCC 7424]|uniref:Uncharacterized protein n=1 Tax=Gloeothece citriformis (strain PCC 7424) TaxID=65393 RepID=B7KHY6_GLOC7|nr:hypothetical protein PCC7424_3702 [Gloeothece citriformis PCC 7424]